MNLVLDVLLLRRPLLNYISPAVCPVSFSASGASLMIESIEGPAAPTGVQLTGQCNRFLIWNSTPEAECVSLYRALDPTQMFGKYESVGECLLPGTISVCSAGWWKITTSSADGTESLPGPTTFVDGTSSVVLTIPDNPDRVRVNLYKNPDPNNPGGAFLLMLSTVSMGVFEVCEDVSCYRLQTVTDDGASDLSTPVCHGLIPGCCAAQPCAQYYIWDINLCSCVPGGVSDIIGPQSPYCVGNVYTSQLTVVGAGSPFLWELVSGALPPGMVLHTGLFSGMTAPIDGTPTSGGSYTFSVRCTPSSGRSMVKQFTITGIGIDQYPTLLAATTDTAYSEQLTVTGGTAPYTFTLVSGSFSKGLNMNSSGLISGTPEFAETDAVVIQVQDAEGVTCSAPLTLVVNACPAVAAYPTIMWTPSVPVSVSAQQNMVFDTKRRYIWDALQFSSGSTTLLSALSTSSKAWVAEYKGTTGYPQNPGSNVQMVYDPVNDIVVMVDNFSNWLRFNPDAPLSFDGMLSDTAGIADTASYRLACDTKRGHILGTSQYPGGHAGYQVVSIPKTGFAAVNLHTQGNSPGDPASVRFGQATYSDYADKFVIVVIGNNPALYYVDPINYTGAFSTVALAASATNHVCYALPGTPYVALKDAAGTLSVVDVLTDTVYYTGNPISSALIDLAYNTCTQVLYVASAVGGVDFYDIPGKNWLGNDLTKTYTSLIFDPAAGYVFGKNVSAPPQTINTL